MKKEKTPTKKNIKKPTKKIINRKYNIVNCIIIIVLIIIIFALLRYCANDKKRLTPTGNIDIFDLKCVNKECPTCNTCKPVVTKPVSGGDKKQDEEESPNPEEEVEGFNVFDNRITWATESELRIFTNPAYEFRDIIAPGSSNTYVFRVRNNNSFNVKYSIDVIEVNNKNINMKYKLKYKNNYVVGDIDSWVKYTELNLDDIYLDANKYDEYTLEWKWIESRNDTEIGLSADAEYSLKIEITGTEI